MAGGTLSVKVDERALRVLELEAQQSGLSTEEVASAAIAEHVGRSIAMDNAIGEALEDPDPRRWSGEAVMAWLDRWAEGNDEAFPDPDLAVLMSHPARQ